MTSKLTQNPKSDPSSGHLQHSNDAIDPSNSKDPMVVSIPTAIGVNDLASLMDVGPIEVIKQLMRMGHMLTINDILDHDTAVKVAQSFEFEIDTSRSDTKELKSLVISTDDEDPDKLETRPPVVTIFGHVDHGKTTLLDSIRDSNIVDGEAGKITQHIGAYQVEFDDSLITFLDTPGHEAFTAMRARGAQITDIAVLVVAADDGIMPQTVEAINHAKASGVPILVAINKVDLPNSDPEKTKRQLGEHDLLIEEWGGEVIALPISALNGTGIPELLTNLLVLAEISDLKANPDQPARGIVIESRIDKRRGPVATVIIQTGTLRIGDIIVTGGVKGRVKAMLDDKGTKISEALPSKPVELLGVNGISNVGDVLTVESNDRSARELAETNERGQNLNSGTNLSLEEVHLRIQSGEFQSLNIIFKTDVQGSIDAVRFALESLNTDQTRINLIHSASGSITESDVLLAIASNAVIIGFNTRPEAGAQTVASENGIDIRFYNIIYDLIDEVGKALEGLLEPAFSDIVEGYATVRAVFKIGRRTTAAGIYVNEGQASRGTEVSVLREKEVIFTGQISSLKHFKDDVREIKSGLEGGISLEGFRDYLEGDILEFHRISKAK